METKWCCVAFLRCVGGGGGKVRDGQAVTFFVFQENGSEEPKLPDLLLPCNFLEDWHEEHDSAARVDQGAESPTSGPVSTIPVTTALPLESTTDLPLPFTTELPPSDHAVAEKPGILLSFILANI